MAHSHSHTSSHLPEDNNARRLLYAFGVTAGFMLVEVVGGFLSGSLALLADAGHMLTDTAALLFALLAVQFSRRPPTIRHTFGWLRLTTLAAFVNAIALVVITILIVWEAIERFRTQGQRFCLSKSGSYRQIPEFTVRTQKITDMGQRNGTGQTSRIYCQHRR